MKVDLTLVLSAIAAAAGIFGVLFAYLSTARLKGTVYSADFNRVELDKTRQALERDLREIYEQIYRDRGRWEELNHLVLDSASARARDPYAEAANGALNCERFLRVLGIEPREQTLDPRLVFVLTPLGRQDLPVYEAIKNECERVGLRARRGDEENISGPILPVVISQIVQARFVVANINGRNPNVFYEMGIAQALGKDVVIVAARQQEEVLPFDLRHQQIVFYSNMRELRRNLSAAITQLGLGISTSIAAKNG